VKNHSIDSPFMDRLLVVLMLIVGTLIVGMVLLTAGCAASAREDGSAVVGFRFGGDGTTASGAGDAVGGIVGLLTGNPVVGTAVGAGLTGILGLLGIGVARSTGRTAGRAEREAQQHRIDLEYREGQLDAERGVVASGNGVRLDARVPVGGGSSSRVGPGPGVNQ